MQFKFFNIPVAAPAEAEEELNVFLHSHRVLTVTREFVNDPANPRWCLAVEFITGPIGGDKNRNRGRHRVDYRELLPPDDFALFAKLREWRKIKAEEEGVPLYAIFTNEQLAKIVSEKIVSKKNLSKIDGVGRSRVEKYGDAVITLADQGEILSLLDSTALFYVSAP